MSDTLADGGSQCVSSPKVTGADIPEELFEHILWHVTHGFNLSHKNIHPPSRRSLVHTFTSLILVCKYFARICRPALYLKVVLRNRQQLRGLLNLLDSRCAPCGISLVVLTQSFCIEGGVDDSLWIHQLGTVLFPRMKDAGVPFPTVNLAMANTARPGFAPFQAQLPRTIPSSLYRHVSKLRLKNACFKSSEDLSRYLSSFHGLRSLHLSACTCEIVTVRPTFIRPSHHLPSMETSLHHSRTLFPVMFSRLLDWYARINSVPYLLHGQAEMLLVVDVMTAVYDELMPSIREQPCNMYSGTSHIFPMPRPSIVIYIQSSSGYGPHVRLTLVLRDSTRYDITIFVISIKPYRISKFWRGLEDHIAYLSRLKTLRWIFCSPMEMKTFVEDRYRALQKMHRSGREMKVGYASDSGEPSEWEPMVNILQRFAPKMEALIEEQAPEATAKEFQE